MGLVRHALEETWREFKRTNMPETELGIVLARHFGSGQESATGMVSFPRGHECAVTAVYRGGRLIRLEPGPLLTPQDCEQISAHLEKISSVATKAVFRSILFSPYSVDGYWRYGELFQILPPPEEAPKRRDMTAPQPFLMEIAYSRCGDSDIDRERRSSALSEVLDLLNVLTYARFHRPTGGRAWVMVDEGEQRVTDLQRYYAIPGLAFEAAHLTSAEGLTPLTAIDPSEYYRWGGMQGFSLALPASLNESLDDYYHLSAAERRVFRRASHWFQRAISSESRSGALTDLVIALETLQPDGSKERCATCDSVLSVTRRFKDFLDDYAPQQGAPHSARVDLYKVRSRLSHGEILLRSDEESRWARMHPDLNRETSQRIVAQDIARIAFVNRLHRSQEPHRANLVEHRPYKMTPFFKRGTIGVEPTRIL